MSKLYFRLASAIFALLIFHLTTTPNLVVTDQHWLNFILMNGAHFGFFGVLAALLKLSMPSYDNHLTIILPITITSLYGLAIEVIQMSVPGRTADVFDWLLDTLGAIVFVLIIARLEKK
jgi:VanZ family protein